MRRAFAFAASLVAACGGPDREPIAPVPPPADAGAPSTLSPPPPPSTSPPSAGVRNPVPAPIASRMDAKLREIGLDPAALPPLDKLDPKQLRDVMNTFTKSLGVTCGHCHEPKDYKAPTENKRIATHMWNDFARTLAQTDGAPLYCDSCHDGRAKMLDRSSGGLGGAMKESYVVRLARTDKREHGCATCHGEPFQGKIFAVRWK